MRGQWKTLRPIVSATLYSESTQNAGHSPLEALTRRAPARFAFFFDRGVDNFAVVCMLSAPKRREMSSVVRSNSFKNSLILGSTRTVGAAIVTQWREESLLSQMGAAMAVNPKNRSP